MAIAEKAVRELLLARQDRSRPSVTPLGANPARTANLKDSLITLQTIESLLLSLEALTEEASLLQDVFNRVNVADGISERAFRLVQSSQGVLRTAVGQVSPEFASLIRGILALVRQMVSLREQVKGMMDLSVSAVAGTTDNTLARWDGAAGTSLQGSGILLNDDDSLGACKVQPTDPSDTESVELGALWLNNG